MKCFLNACVVLHVLNAAEVGRMCRKRVSCLVEEMLGPRAYH